MIYNEFLHCQESLKFQESVNRQNERRPEVKLGTGKWTISQIVAVAI